MTESKCVYFWNCMKELPNVLAITEDIEKNTSLQELFQMFIQIINSESIYETTSRIIENTRNQIDNIYDKNRTISENM